MTAPQPPKSQQQLADMPPAAREQYLQQQADAGYPDDGSWFGNLLNDFKRSQAENAGKQRAAAIGTKNVTTLSSGHDVEFVPGLQASDGLYLGTDHAQLKQYVNTNLNTGQVTDVSNAYAGVQKAFDNFGTKFNAAVNKSQGAWEGDSAEAARGYFSSLTKWSDANSQNAQLAAETIYEQSNAAAAAKSKMPDPVPFSWNDEFKKWATAGPLDMGTAVGNSFKLQQQSQKAHEEAAGVLSQYDKDLYTAASKQPVFADPPKFAATGGGGTNNPMPTGGGGTHSSSDFSSAGGGGGTSSSSASQGKSTDAGTQQQLQPGNTTGGVNLGQGHTSAQSFQPQANIAPPPAASNNSGMGGMGPMPMGGMGGMGGFGDAEEYNSKLGRGGFGPGGSGSLSGGSSEQAAGSGSGAAKPGGVGAAESAAGRGMGSTPGKTGASGGMGGGRGGEGEEDQEHQRPTYLVEGDPDEVFGTNERTSPPVIGE
jgi:hypothetical protein